MTSRLLAQGVGRCLRQHQRGGSMPVIAIRYASGGSSYNEATGNLFGEKAPAPGKKRAKEDWEDIWTYGLFGGMALGAVLLFYKPDTSIQTWALIEAKKQLEEEGGVWKYEPSPNSGYPDGFPKGI